MHNVVCTDFFPELVQRYNVQDWTEVFCLHVLQSKHGYFPMYIAGYMRRARLHALSGVHIFFLELVQRYNVEDWTEVFCLHVFQRYTWV